ncbi:MAG TPA: cation-transporting P-type ATPase [Kineosporiaceae bacterium]|nr:cation-transporting P-type ATPase [Kineosporiaceae bacterium]
MTRPTGTDPPFLGDSVGTPSAGGAVAGSRWFRSSPAEAVEAFDVVPGRGLSEGEARRRGEAAGPNRLIEAASRSRWLLLADQFRSLLIAILLAAALLALAIGDRKDALVIAVVVLVNAGLGFTQEYRADRSLAALRRMLVATARVRRDRLTVQIPSDTVVPGDVALVEAGDRIPADGRWLVAHELHVDESALTGESTTVGKNTERLAQETVALADQRCMGFMNTTVTQGRGELLITATGMDTAMGSIARMLRESDQPPTPLQRQLDGLGRRLAAVAGIAVTVVLILGLLRGEDLTEEVLGAIALAVAAIPEGLPAVVTVTLALGTAHLARAGAIVKRLSSVETLGSTTVICSDKTGTLTVNQMTVTTLSIAGRRFRVDGEGYTPVGAIVADPGPGTAPDPGVLLRPLALCNDSRVTSDGAPVGDPTEVALVVAAIKAGIDVDPERQSSPRVAEIPFDSARKFMATFHRAATEVQVLVKGAPDVLVERSQRVLTGAGPLPLDSAGRAELARENDALAAQGLRVMAGAIGTIAVDQFDPAADLLAHIGALTFLGLAGITDPPRAEARQAIATCHQAGIQVKMITGDHARTAGSIAEALGIPGAVITGADLDRMTPHEVAQRMDSVGVFARVAPEHKVLIVEALQERGDVVAMTGDGVNDAPALRRADIGVAMGRAGTEVAKEAAAMVLTDDNFATIVLAVQRGRAIYDNIVKFVRFQLSTNLGAILTIVGASLLGLPRPFTPIQVLWVNLIMDGPPGIALGIDPPGPGTMDRAPRSRREPVLTLRRVVVLLGYGAVMAAGTLGVLAGVDGQRAATAAFTTFVLFQAVNVFNVRSEEHTIFRRHTLTNYRLWLAIAAVVGMQVAAVQLPLLQGIFDTTPLRLQDWALVTATAATLVVADEARKVVLRRSRPAHGSPAAPVPAATP